MSSRRSPRSLQRLAAGPGAGGSALGVAASVLLHAAVIGVCAWYTRLPGHYAEGGSTELLRFLVPPDRVPSHVIAHERIEWVRTGLPEGWGVSDIDGERPGNEIDAAPRHGDRGADPEVDFRKPISIDDLIGSGQVFTAYEVDSVVERSALSGAPMYPQALLEANVEGKVRARYVVDTLGRVDSATFEVLASTNAGFTAAVLEAVPYMRFKPAVASGHHVAQLVEQVFEFRIQKPEKKVALRPRGTGRTLAMFA